MRVRALITLLTALIGVGAMYSATAQADSPFGNVNYFMTNYVPSIGLHKLTSSAETDVSCYAEGDPAEMLACPFTFAVLGLGDTATVSASGFTEQASDYGDYLINGGHTHTDAATVPRLFGYPDNEPDALSLVGTSVISSGAPCITQLNKTFPAVVAGHLCISGNTSGSIPQVWYSLPETGGIVAAMIYFTSPPGWFCASYCYDFTHAVSQEDVRIGYFVYGRDDTQFTALPASGPDYIFSDTSTDHQDATGFTWGRFLTPAAEFKFLPIAHIYHNLKGLQLSVNDMSLPVGGMFDVQPHNWTIQAHQTHTGHRDGIAVDINIFDLSNNSVPCTQDKPLTNAVIAVLGKANIKSKLFCETGGRKHINLFPIPVFGH